MVIRNPLAIRPWQHVCEPLNGYLNLARKLFEDSSAFSEAWNFGPFENANKTVGWIADCVQRKWPDSLPWITSEDDNPPEVQILKLENSKAMAYLGWRLMLSLDVAIGWTFDWCQAWLDKQNMKEFTLKQFQAFLNLMEQNDDK